MFFCLSPYGPCLHKPHNNMKKVAIPRSMTWENVRIIQTGTPLISAPSTNIICVTIVFVAQTPRYIANFARVALSISLTKKKKEKRISTLRWRTYRKKQEIEPGYLLIPGYRQSTLVLIRGSSLFCMSKKQKEQMMILSRLLFTTANLTVNLTSSRYYA